MEKKWFIYIASFVLLLSTMSANAQYWREHKYEFYYGVGLTNFMADIGAPNTAITSSFIKQSVWVNFRDNVSGVGRVGVDMRISGRHFVGVNVDLGYLRAADGGVDRGYYGYNNGSGRMRYTANYFVDFYGRYKFMVFEERKRRTVYRQLGQRSLKNFSLPTYLFIGAGGVANLMGKAEVYYANKQGEDFVENYNNFAAVIPYGFGFQKKIQNSNIMVSIEATWYFALSNYLDYDSHDVFVPVAGDGFDQYQTITFNVIHTFKADRRGRPVIKF